MADISSIQGPSNTKPRSHDNPESYHISGSSSYVKVPVPFSQTKTFLIRDIPSKSSKPSKSGKKSHK